MTRTSLSELFSRYVERQAAAQAEGVGYAAAGEVEPYDAGPVQPVDPELAWRDAVAVATHFSVPPITWEAPPEWAALTAAQEPAVAVPFALGSFPQLVRNLQPLLGSAPPALRVSPARPLAVSGLDAWAARQTDDPRRLLAAAVYRLAGRPDDTARLLAAPPAAAWRAAHANETAALAWSRGEAEAALALWTAQEPSVPVLFNRGMAALFLGRPELSRESLTLAAAKLPESGAWHHLARLYLTLAG